MLFLMNTDIVAMALDLMQAHNFVYRMVNGAKYVIFSVDNTK